MFRTPIPRSSFLDSPLRVSAHENRRLVHNTPVGLSHLGRAPRSARSRQAPSRRRGRAPQVGGPLA